MNIIKFSHNWNKKLSQEIFTTIRKYDNKKWNYYKSQENNNFHVMLNNDHINNAKLLSVEYLIFNELPKALICSDTGLSYKEALGVFRKFGITIHDRVLVLTFKSIY
ncbi:MAG: hypothetical protein ACTSPD_10055 [Promethearchaeota archaeon]